MRYARRSLKFGSSRGGKWRCDAIPGRLMAALLAVHSIVPSELTTEIL